MADFATTTISYSETRSDGGYRWPVSYDIRMTDSIIYLDLRIKLTGDDPGSLRAVWENGIETIWNHNVFFSDGNRLYEVIISTDFVTSGEHATVEVHNHLGRADSSNWYTSTDWGPNYDDEVAAHEFGHNMGLFDEYAGGATYNGYTTTGTLMSDLTQAGFLNYYWPIEHYVEQNAGLTLSTVAAIPGTAAGEALAGGAGMDGIYGLSGDDTIVGNAGNDYLVGEAGNDMLRGGDGDDILRGGAGDDHLEPGTGVNTIDGGDGTDIVVIENSRYLYERVDTPTGIQLIGTGTAAGERYDITNVEDFSFTNMATNVSQSFAPIGSNTLVRNDDGSSSFIDLSDVFLDGIDFYGNQFTGLYVNNNGNVTFGNSLSTYTPGQIGAGSSLRIIAPFWADVDTRDLSGNPPPAENGLVYYNLDKQHGSITVTWLDVGYYSAPSTSYVHKTNSFQLQLVDAGSGDFEIIFRYSDINWTTGNASGGSQGLGGTPARAGFSAGTGVYGQYYELPQSGSEGSMLALEDSAGNLGDTGIWQFRVSNGAIEGIGGDSDDTLNGTDAGNFIDGGAGNDTLRGHGGNDFLYGRAGNDTLRGDDGDDHLDGGAGTDTAEYGAFPAGSIAPIPSGLTRGNVTLSRNTDGSVQVVTTGDGTDTLADIERLHLNDGSFIFDVGGNQATLVYRLYQAAFARTPDEGGFRYWATAVDQWSINQLALAREFQVSQEFIDNYGANVSNRTYTYNMYRNVLQREPDAGGIDYWTAQVNANAVSRDQLLIEFAQCAENVALTTPNTEVGYWVV